MKVDKIENIIYQACNERFWLLYYTWVFEKMIYFVIECYTALKFLSNKNKLNWQS